MSILPIKPKPGWGPDSDPTPEDPFSYSDYIIQGQFTPEEWAKQQEYLKGLPPKEPWNPFPNPPRPPEDEAAPLPIPQLPRQPDLQVAQGPALETALGSSTPPQKKQSWWDRIQEKVQGLPRKPTFMEAVRSLASTGRMPQGLTYQSPQQPSPQGIGQAVPPGLFQRKKALPMQNPWASYVNRLPQGSPQVQNLMQYGQLAPEGQDPFTPFGGGPSRGGPAQFGSQVGGGFGGGESDFFTRQSRQFSQAAAPKEQEALGQALRPRRRPRLGLGGGGF